MKNLFFSFIAVIFSIFILSFVLLNTTWLDSYFLEYKNQYNCYLINIKFFTSLILIFFLISHANYMITLNRDVKRNKTHLHFGLFFSMLIIFKMLVFYYAVTSTTTPLLEVKNKKMYYGSKQAKNTFLNAKMIYLVHGISIEYYDANESIQKYTPSSDDIKSRKKDQILDEDITAYKKVLHSIPIKITIVFLTVFFAFYLSSIVANRKNKTLKINS